MNNQAIQKQDLAGKTKLTAVNIVAAASGLRHTVFVRLHHDSNGRAILPSTYLNQLLRGLPRGATFTCG